MRSIILAILCTIVAPAALAVPVTYNFTGSLTLIENLSGTGPVAGFALGDTISGTLTYESGVALAPGLQISRQELLDAGLFPLAPGDTADPSLSYFHAGMDATGDSVSQQVIGGSSLFSLSFSTAGGNFSVDPSNSTSLYRHRTNEWVPTPDRPAFAYDTLFLTQFDNTTTETTGIRLMDDDVFTGLFPVNVGAQSLAALPGLSDLFLGRVFGITTLDDGTDVQVFAALDSLTAVPEPGTLALLGAGLLGLWFRKKAA